MALELHRWLAILSAALVALVAIESAWSLRNRSAASPAGSRFQAVMLLALGVTIAGGLGLLVGGARPRELLHFVYAALAVGALPVAASIARGSSPRRRRMATLVAALVAIAAVLRLFATG